MVVGRDEKTDITLDPSAKWIEIGGTRYRDLTVYSDADDSRRRDVFVPREAQDGDLPEQARVRYLGRTYTARLGFRTASGGARVPVYTWNVTNRAEA